MTISLTTAEPCRRHHSGSGSGFRCVCPLTCSKHRKCSESDCEPLAPAAITASITSAVKNKTVPETYAAQTRGDNAIPHR